MYQSIDDPQDELDASKPKRPKSNGLIWGASALGLLAILAVVYWTSPGVSAPQGPDDFLQAELSTYRKAISETKAPMRRARLQDFLTTYPSSERTPAVEAQLDIIRQYEASQWLEVTDTVYDPQVIQLDKLAVLEAFEAKWGGALLGGRNDEIRSMREALTISGEAADAPSRKLQDQQSPIPDSVPDGTLAGGPRAAPPPAVFIPPVPIERPVTVVTAEIVPPKVRRNVNPRYPRKAMRGKVEAVVTLKLNIDAEGKVAMTELVNVEARKYGKSFVKAAERAALRTKFHPKTVGGKPQPAVGVTKRYRFQLEE